jgi:glutathione S-transferase
MLQIYHYPLCPFSRKLRIVLQEKGIEFALISEHFWKRRPEFLALSPMGTTPVIKALDGSAIWGNYAIFEYIEEIYPKNKMLGSGPIERAHIRNCMEWFDTKFYQEVGKYLLNERIIKIITREEAPNSEHIRAATRNIPYHMDYIAFLLKQKFRYLCSDVVTLADITCAAHLSLADYVDAVPWERHQSVKEWYALIKSRPSFRSILVDVIPGLAPPIWYSNPDF